MIYFWEMSDIQVSDRRVSTLIWTNLVMIITVIFGAGTTYQRVAGIELRIGAMEAREAQLDTIAAIQAEVKALHDEVVRARDRVDRAVDLATHSK